MSWNKDHYKFDKDDNFFNKEEFETAVNNGDVEKLSNSDCYWDKKTGEEYWSDGTKK